MRGSIGIFLKGLLSAALGLFSIPVVGYGGYLLWCWVRIHANALYYADYPYASAGLAFLAVGLLSLWATLYGVWRRSFYGLLFLVPVFIGLATMVLVPNIPPHGFSSVADTNYLSSVTSFFRVWYEKNHRFPANDKEFKEALQEGPAAWQYRVEDAPTSRYKQRGGSLPYEIVVASDANGPRVTDVSERPGVIYYNVSSDLQEFWVTMTSLRSDVASTAVIRHIGDIPEEPLELVHANGHDYPVKKP
jgi:hypothetical protein